MTSEARTESKDFELFPLIFGRIFHEEIQDGVCGLDTTIDCLIAYVLNIQFGDGTGWPHHKMSNAVGNCGGGSHNALIASYPRIGQWLVVFAQAVALDVAARLLHFRMLADVGIAERVRHGFKFHHEVLSRDAVSLGKLPFLLFVVMEFYAFYHLVMLVEIDLVVMPDSVEFGKRVVEHGAVPDDERTYCTWRQYFGGWDEGEAIDDALELVADERILAVRVAVADGFAHIFGEYYKYVLVAM